LDGLYVIPQLSGGDASLIPGMRIQGLFQGGLLKTLNGFLEVAQIQQICTFVDPFS
jgi:hypothetical protein